MLMAAADTGDPADFPKTELYQRCLAAGIIPASSDDLIRHTVAEKSPAEESFSFKPAYPDGQTSLDTPRLGIDLIVDGMWCPACAWVIEESLRRSAGIFSPRCHFAMDRLHCTYDPVATSPAQIKDVIAKLGYSARDAAREADTGAANTDLIRLLICAFLGMNVMMLSFALYTGFFAELSFESVRSLSWPIFFLATVVVGYGGRPIFKKAWAGIRSGSPGMEVLITMGSASAYFYSVYNLLAGSIHLYFDTAGMLIVLTLIGKAIEDRARKKVRRSLDGLLSLMPGKVCLLTPEFPRGHYVDIAQLKDGDQFKVDTDEILPADGIVISGRAQVDESALTGEPRPVGAAPGTPLKSGSRLVSGSAFIKATATGSRSLLGQMIAVIQESLSQKSALESRTDHILRYFAPAVILLALSTGAYCLLKGYPLETALVRTVTVMVIACPCALGIAVPMTRVAGISLAGERGIIVREFSAFEQAGRIDTVIFDKTGTLTMGQWRLIRIECLYGDGQDHMLRLAAGLEAGSDHLVAHEIRRELTQQGLTPVAVDDGKCHPDGVSGDFQGHRYQLGSRRFVSAAAESELAPEIAALADGISRVYLSRDGIITAVLYFGDQLQPNAAALVKELYSRNLDLYMVTGDDKGSADAVAARLDIKNVRADMLPLEKAALVDNFRKNGRTVAMVGDGVNDAPALSRADLSVAVAGSNSLTGQSAQVTFMGTDPYQLLEFIALAGRVSRKIHQNLWCALIYNVISIPVAMGGWISPLVAVAAMLASSLTVTGNTYMLSRRKI